MNFNDPIKVCPGSSQEPVDGSKWQGRGQCPVCERKALRLRHRPGVGYSVLQHHIDRRKD